MVLSMMIGIRNSVTSLGENEKLYDFETDDDAFKDINLFDFKQKSFEKEVVSSINVKSLSVVMSVLRLCSESVL